MRPPTLRKKLYSSAISYHLYSSGCCGRAASFSPRNCFDFYSCAIANHFEFRMTRFRRAIMNGSLDYHLAEVQASSSLVIWSNRWQASCHSLSFGGGCVLMLSPGLSLADFRSRLRYKCHASGLVLASSLYIHRVIGSLRLLESTVKPQCVPLFAIESGGRFQCPLHDADRGDSAECDSEIHASWHYDWPRTENPERVRASWLHLQPGLQHSQSCCAWNEDSY